MNEDLSTYDKQTVDVVYIMHCMYVCMYVWMNETHMLVYKSKN